jgi:hypothetical protein
MTVTKTNDIVRAIVKVARAAVSAKGQNKDWLDRAKWTEEARAAWEKLQKEEPKIYYFLQIVLALDPYKLPLPRGKETPADFVARVRDAAHCEVDTWDAGVRSGLDIIVCSEVAKAIARRLREPDGKKGAAVSRARGERVIAMKHGDKNAD